MNNSMHFLVIVGTVMVSQVCALCQWQLSVYMMENENKYGFTTKIKSCLYQKWCVSLNTNFISTIKIFKRVLIFHNPDAKICQNYVFRAFLKVINSHGPCCLTLSCKSPRSSQCFTTGVTKAVVCVILYVGWCI